MKRYERKAVKYLYYGREDEEAFIKAFRKDPKEHLEYIMKLLETAIRKKHADDLEAVLGIGFYFDLFDQSFVDILNQLLKEPWHTKHEDIAFTLKEIKSPKSADVLYETAKTKFAYLAYDNSQALARKCIWGLGEIGTEEAYDKLRHLAKSDEEYIRKVAHKQMVRRGLVEECAID